MTEGGVHSRDEEIAARGLCLSPEARGAFSRVNGNIEEMAESGVAVVAAKAKEMMEKIKSGQVQMMATGPEARTPTDLGYEIFGRRKDNRRLTGVVRVNVEFVTNIDDVKLQTDLARTMGLDTYPEEGSLDRQTDRMKRGLALQREWTGKVSRDLFFGSTQEQRLLSVLGEADFYASFGFADWQKAMNDYMAREFLSARERNKLRRMGRDGERFLINRQELTLRIYDELVQEFGEAYLRGSEERRARVAAGKMVEKLVERA